MRIRLLLFLKSNRQKLNSKLIHWERSKLHNTHLPFNLLLSSEDAEIPTIISDKEITCSKDTNNKSLAICSYKEQSQPSEKMDTIYYIGACGEKKSTGISVRTFYKKIEVTNISLSDNSNCHTDEIKDIRFTLNTEPTGKIYEAVLSDGKNYHSFDDCNYMIRNVTCRTLTPITEEGTFTLSYIKGDDNYSISKVAKSELVLQQIEDVFGEQSNTVPVINNETNSFTIVLASNETESPRIFIDENNEIDCNKTEILLICSPSESKPIEYEIFYRGACGKLISTGIIVINQRNEIEYKNSGEFLTNKRILFFLLFLLLII